MSSSFGKPPKLHTGNAGAGALDALERMGEVDLSRLSVLVIDDNKFVRRLVAEILRSFGVKEIFEADSATAAIDQMAIGVNFDLIISDWSMHPSDGLFVLRSVRSGKTGLKPQTPFVVLTGECRQNKVIEALAEGASSYIVKPISAKLLMGHLIKLILDEKDKYELD